MCLVTFFIPLVCALPMASKSTILEESRKNNVRRIPVRQSSIRDPLSIDNYKEKFTELIETEREEHRRCLKQRCKGKFEYYFGDTNCPKGATTKSNHEYKMYGILKGLDAEDLAYVKQNASSVTITCGSIQATADLMYNRQDYDQLFLAFPDSHEIRDDCDVSVIFHLKEHYFDDLIQSVENLNIIPRLIPTSFEPISQEESLISYESHCSAEQLDALKVIVNSSPNGPPVLLTGAVGTRKSQLLAISALHFLTKSSNPSTRILVCTQQQFSADKFLDYFLRPHWSSRNNDIIFVIQECENSSIDSAKRKYYMSSEKFKEINPNTYQSMLVITTCLTAPHMKKYLPVGFFSHIFIDEASHMREPEAVAPLCYANDETKIIIAGDTNQVGPANSVRGHEARANSLRISLLQRLEKCYNSCNNCQLIANLTCCTHCHPEILKLVSDLFYDSSLKCDEQEIPGTHRKHPYPLVFKCSSVDKSFNLCNLDLEAEIIVKEVLELTKRTPNTWNTSKPMKNYLITTPCEKQVSKILNKFKSQKCDEFPKIKTEFQGQEYQAAILSTSEPVNQDGSSLDSTKSFCDPYVFNTVITRAKSLVVAVGNPFLLFGMERGFVRKYGDEHNAHCWSTYLDSCIKNNSFYIDENLKLTAERKNELIDTIKKEIIEIQKVKRLELQNEMLQQWIEILQQEKEVLQQENEVLQQEKEGLQQMEVQSQYRPEPKTIQRSGANPLYTAANRDNLVRRKFPKNMMKDVDYKSFCNKIEFLLLTESDLEFNAAATYLQNPSIEKYGNMQDVATMYQPNIALGMFAGGPVALIKSSDVKHTKELSAMIKKIFPESKYVISTGTGYGFQQEMEIGDVFVSSGLTAIDEYSVSIVGSIAYVHILGNHVETFDLLQTIFCLNSKVEKKFEITNNRTAKYQISNIVSGCNVLEDKRLHEVTDIVLDPKAKGGDTMGKLLMNLQNEEKIEGFIVIKSVTEYIGMQDAVTLEMKDAWKFTGTLAAVHYIEQKMIPYMNHATSVEHYMSALKTGDIVNVMVAKLIFFGPPMQGKTVTRRRLTKEIQNISSEEKKSSSNFDKSNTGVSEQNTVLICKDMLRAKAFTKDDGDWIVLDNDEETKFFVTQKDCKVTFNPIQKTIGQDTKILYDDKKELECVTKVEHIQSTDSLYFEGVERGISQNELSVIKKEFNQSKSLKTEEVHIEWARNILGSLKKSKSYNLEKFRSQLDNRCLLYMQDTGGQPELMECLPVLTIGPALYLLFCKLNSKLDDTYEIGYRGSDRNILSYPSHFTVKDTLLSAMASVASMSYSLKDQDEDFENVPKRRGYVYLVGTHRDKVNNEEVNDFELKLQEVLKSTFFFEESLIKWWYKKDLPPEIGLSFDTIDARFVYPLDNQDGNDEEIKCLRSSINKRLASFFGNQKIPTSWLVFGICLHKAKTSFISLESCIKLGSELNMSEDVTLSALQFLHYNLGICMHFNNIQALKNIVIPDTQLVYKSLTTLIEAAFKPSETGPADIELFKKKGQFSVEKFKGASSNFSLPLDKLVIILEHLNIIIPHISNENPEKTLYFMPCILPNASKDEIVIFEQKHPISEVLSPLFIRYNCGFIPLGVFSSMVTNLIQQASTEKDFTNISLNPTHLRRNFVQFWYNLDVITFIHKPEYIQIQFSQSKKNEQTLHESCNLIRNLVKKTLASITARMLNSLYTATAKVKYNTHFQSYKFGFKCYEHADHDHLCVVNNEESPEVMICVGDGNNTPFEMKPGNLLWYGQKFSTSKTYSSEATQEISEAPEAACATSSDLVPKPSILDIKKILRDDSPHNVCSSVPPVAQEPATREDKAEVLRHDSTSCYSFTMKSLTMLKWTDSNQQKHRISLINQISPNWKKASYLLGLTLDHTQRIEKNNRTVEDCCQEVMAQWLTNTEGMYQYPTNWKGLCELLEDMELSSIAEEICNLVSSKEQ